MFGAGPWRCRHIERNSNSRVVLYQGCIPGFLIGSFTSRNGRSVPSHLRQKERSSPRQPNYSDPLRYAHRRVDVALNFCAHKLRAHKLRAHKLLRQFACSRLGLRTQAYLSIASSSWIRPKAAYAAATDAITRLKKSRAVALHASRPRILPRIN